MTPSISLLAHLKIAGAVVLDDAADFPANPLAGTIAVKNETLYGYVQQGGSLKWVALAQAPSVYTHEQTQAATEWTVQHNLASSNVLYQVQDASGEVVYFAQFTSVNNNSFKIGFTEATAGKVIVFGTATGFSEAPAVDLSTLVPKTAVGQANGVAALDATGKVPVAQLPAGTANGVATLGADGKVPAAQLPAQTGGGLENVDESVNRDTPNAAKPVVRLLAMALEANVDLALTPKGNGALLAQVPDNAIAGGSKRGNNAVDFQRVRSTAAQVASGPNSTISGGARNKSASESSTVAGGYQNTADGQYATVAGGASNTASGYGATVLGGFRNLALGSSAVVLGGDTAQATGLSALAHGGGISATGDYSIAIGQDGRAQGRHSVALGNSSVADGNYSMVTGRQGSDNGVEHATVHGNLGWQTAIYRVFCDNGPVFVTTPQDDSTPSMLNQVPLREGTMASVEVDVLVHFPGAASARRLVYRGLVSNFGGQPVVNLTQEADQTRSIGSTTASLNLTFSFDQNNQALQIGITSDAPFGYKAAAKVEVIKMEAWD